MSDKAKLRILGPKWRIWWGLGPTRIRLITPYTLEQCSKRLLGIHQSPERWKQKLHIQLKSLDENSLGYEIIMWGIGKGQIGAKISGYFKRWSNDLTFVAIKREKVPLFYLILLAVPAMFMIGDLIISGLIHSETAISGFILGLSYTFITWFDTYLREESMIKMMSELFGDDEFDQPQAD